MQSEEGEQEFWIPEVGSAWVAIDQPEEGTRARFVVSSVTNPFVSDKYGRQYPTVVLVGRDQYNQPSNIAYPLWMFMDLYTPEYVPCMYRIVPKKSSEAQPRVEYTQAQWGHVAYGENNDHQG